MNGNAVAERKPARRKTCTTCLGEHDEDIHSATLKVREWFRRQVIKNFEENLWDGAPWSERAAS